MPVDTFAQRLDQLQREYAALIERPNLIDPRWTNGWFDRYVYPVATGAHAPLFWRYDLNPVTNPYLMERLGVNGAYNTGAIELDGKILLVLRMEGNDRKSFFAVAESETGVDRFRFWDYPVVIPETETPDTNIYDMRLTHHEDGWIYGVFCTERKDPAAPPSDMSSAVAQAGIARTKDLKAWQRLPDLKTPSAQQRNVVLHPEFVDGQYAFYTRPQDSFIDAGSGGGIGWGLPAAVGAKVALPDRPVVAIVGDGSAMYTCQALWTAARYRLGIVFVILNNSSYRILKQRVNALRGHAAQTGTYVGMDLEDPAIDFQALARSMGVASTLARTVDEAVDQIRTGIAGGRATLVEVTLDRGLGIG